MFSEPDLFRVYKPAQSLQARHGVGKDGEAFSTVTDNVQWQTDGIELSSEDACIVW